MTEKSEGDKTLFEHKILSTGQAVAYTLPNAGLQAILAIAVSFTLLFYINIMGQPPIVVGGIFSAGLVVYAMMCIIGGAIADKIGKKKVMLISGPVMAIAFIFIWMPPIPDTKYGQIYLPLIIWFLIFSFSFRMMIGAFQSSMLALFPELSTDEKNRVKVSMINMLMTILGIVIGIIGPFILMSNATQNLSREDPNLYYKNSASGQAIYSQIMLFVILIGIFFLVLMTLMMLIIKEPKKTNREHTGFKDILRGLSKPLKDRNYRRWLITFFIFWVPFMAFQFLAVNLATFVLDLRGIEFLIAILIGFISTIFSFVIWQKISQKFSLKKTFTICLIFSSISFSLILILIIPMTHQLTFIFGVAIICLCFCSLVGTMTFPFAIMGDLIDSAESKADGKSLSGTYSGAFIMIGSLAAALSMLIVSIILQLFGPESPISYALIISVVGSGLILIAVIIFQKVPIVGTEQR
ncbi:MAG: MFS transporter [Promethearchaeota archaeon]|nr:MAG: MFS transporter [Candidatus Lokiarchaeota archaeon]